MSNISRRSGRRSASDRVRELVALISALSRCGDSISLEAISRRLGISLEEAASWMDIICAASGEQSPGLLMSTNDEQTEFTLQYPAAQGRPLRLTELETTAVIHGLDECGIERDDPMRRRIMESLAAPTAQLEGITRALGEGASNENLITCMWAQVEERIVCFDYLGLKDTSPRPRRAIIRHMRKSGEFWHAHAWDADLEQDRIFRLDRMTNVRLAEIRRIPDKTEELSTYRVGIRFSDRRYYTLFEWPGLQVLSEVDGIIQADIPYYGEHSNFLERRIVACEGTVVCEDERIMEAARSYAAAMLAYAADDDG